MAVFGSVTFHTLSYLGQREREKCQILTSLAGNKRVVTAASGRAEAPPQVQL